jgi:4'-phosphopantetheinyl transferase
MIEIGAGEVHVWHGSLDVPDWRAAEYRQYLSQDEHERAERYIKREHGGRFTVGRGMLRDVLSRYTGVPPYALRFSYGAQGKPELEEAALRFNVAHSDAALIIAVTAGQAVGIDIERVRSLPDMRELSQRFLPALETTSLWDLLSHDERTAFFQRWTRTEALLKASGTGITGLRRLNEDELAKWTICQIDAPSGFVAALAVEGQLGQVMRMEL